MIGISVVGYPADNFNQALKVKLQQEFLIVLQIPYIL